MKVEIEQAHLIALMSAITVSFKKMEPDLKIAFLAAAAAATVEEPSTDQPIKAAPTTVFEFDPSEVNNHPTIKGRGDRRTKCVKILSILAGISPDQAKIAVRDSLNSGLSINFTSNLDNLDRRLPDFHKSVDGMHVSYVSFYATVRTKE